MVNTMPLNTYYDVGSNNRDKHVRQLAHDSFLLNIQIPLCIYLPYDKKSNFLFISYLLNKMLF